jgi:Transposase domain (DUF772)
MLLKHYLGLSDELLIERLNTDWCMLYFCDIQLGDGKIGLLAANASTISNRIAQTQKRA